MRYLYLLYFLFGLNFAHAQTKIVAFGDSLTAGYQLQLNEAFPAQLEKRLEELGIKVSIQNAGVSGDTTTGGLERLDWVIPEGTDAVILELGANDMFRGVDPKSIEKNLDTIISKLKSRNIAVYLCGMLADPSLGAAYGENFNHVFVRLKDKYNLMFDQFFLEGVLGNASLLLRDGIHPNAKGVEVIANRLAPKIKEFIETEIRK